MALTQKVWILLGAALAVTLIYLLRPILTPFIVSAILAYLGDPLVDRLQRLRLSRSLAVRKAQVAAANKQTGPVITAH